MPPSLKTLSPVWQPWATVTVASGKSAKSVLSLSLPFPFPS